MNINQIIYNNNERVKSSSSTNLARLELCRVDDIDYINMKATVHLLESARIIPNVWICSTAKFGDKGFIYPPEIGSIAILGTTNKEESFILAFTSYLGQQDIQEDLLPGEILMQSKGYSFIKEDNAGNVTIGSPSNNFIVVGGDKEINQFSVNATSQTSSTKVVSGIIDEDVRYVEKTYDEKIGSPLTTEELANAALRGGEIPIKEPHPAIITEKGNIEGDEARKLVYKKRVFRNVFGPVEETYSKTIGKDGRKVERVIKSGDAKYSKTIEANGDVVENSKENINIVSAKNLTAESQNSTIKGNSTATVTSQVTTINGDNTAVVEGGTVQIKGGTVKIEGGTITIEGGDITISGNIKVLGSINMKQATVECPHWPHTH